MLPASLPDFVGLLAPALPETAIRKTAWLPSVEIDVRTISNGAFTALSAFVRMPAAWTVSWASAGAAVVSAATAHSRNGTEALMGDSIRKCKGAGVRFPLAPVSEVMRAANSNTASICRPLPH